MALNSMSQRLDRTDEVDVVVGLDEGEDVARLVAPEALVAPGLLAHVERRGPLGVERAQADPVAARLAELDDLADDVDDRGHRPDPLDVLVRDRHDRQSAPGYWVAVLSSGVSIADDATACASGSS